MGGKIRNKNLNEKSGKVAHSSLSLKIDEKTLNKKNKMKGQETSA